VQVLRGEVLSIIDGLLALPSTKSKLALESGGSLYSEVAGRLVIPVHSKYASMGIVHDTSRSGKTVYVEPTEVVAVTNELKQAEGELRAEEGRIWRMLSNEIFCNQYDLEASAYLLGQLDLVHARFQLGIKLKGVIPEVQNEGVISVQNAKHPVLLLRQIDVVGSTIELGADGNQGLVLTGPNSGACRG
jgi:DNA mismatch repair protein MutS2